MTMRSPLVHEAASGQPIEKTFPDYIDMTFNSNTARVIEHPFHRAGIMFPIVWFCP